MKTRNFLIALSLVPIFFAGALLGQATGVDPIMAGLAFDGLAIVKVVVINNFPNIKLFTGFAASIDITALAANLGAYNREFRDILVSEMLLDEDFTQGMTVYDDVTDELPLPNLSLTDLIQPGVDPTFNPINNAIKFGSRTLKVRQIKVDLLLVPSVLEKTWLGKMKKATDPDDMPFEKFIMGYINSKVRENLRLKAIYKGVYNAAGATPADTMNGWNKVILLGIAAGDIVQIATGAITFANVIDKVELTYDGLGEAYKAQPSVMKVSPVIFDWYVRQYRATHGRNMDYQGMKKNRVPIDGSLCEIEREPGLNGSQRLICTPEENFAYGVDTQNGYNMDVQKFDRSLKVLIDFKAGVDFNQVVANALAVNDQA